MLAVRLQSSMQGLIPRGSLLPDKGFDLDLIENACDFSTTERLSSRHLCQSQIGSSVERYAMTISTMRRD